MSTGIRLAVGSARLPSALFRGRASDNWKLISVDIFATLLCRCSEDDAAWREGALRAAQVARQYGLPIQNEPVALRRAIERRLSEALIHAGKDPEFSHQEVLAEMLREFGAGDWAEAEAEKLAAWELKREFAYTRPIAKMAGAVQQWASAGKRVVAISDTRYTAPELALLLARHNIIGLATIYASADFNASKFSGKLFDLVTQREGVERRQILHIGDDLCCDALSAAQRGTAVRRVSRPINPQSLPEAPLNNVADPAFAVGYETFGPVLVAFARLLFHRAQQDGIRQLAFVARDGELLLRVAQVIAEECEEYQNFTLKYLHLSRRAIACASPDLQDLQSGPAAVERVLAALRNIRGMGTALEGFQNYYNVPAELIARHATRLHAEAGDLVALRHVLLDPVAASDLARSLAPMRETVRRYLVQEDLLDGHSALVDIGWRASLQKIIRAESQGWGLPSPRGYYLGLWDEGGSSFPEDALGLISDKRRGRGLYEGSAWHAAFLLEAVCRAKHGMVTGFVEGAEHRIFPIHIEEGRTREAERESELIQNRIQEGVIAYAQWFTRNHPILVADEEEIRREAQRRLLKLAFFPAPNERAVGYKLTYSEPTSDDSALFLINDVATGLHGWLAGLRSPWKGGYIREKGGRAAAAAYCTIEGLVSRLPDGTKPAIRRLLLHGE